MKTIFMSLLCLIPICIISTGYAEISNRVVAIVNDEVITLYELNKRIKELTGQRADDIRTEDEELFIKTRESILKSMTYEKIALEKARELGLEATQEEIDSYIENIKTANKMTQEDLISQLEKEGLAYEAFRKRIKEEMERNRLIDYKVQSKTVIREDQIIKYYEEHKDGYKIEGQVDIASIYLIKSGTDDPEASLELKKKGEHILTRLKEGDDFGALAKEFSEGPGADDGGNLGSFKTSQIDQELLEILNKLPEGGVSELIDRGNALQIIKLIKRDQEMIRPFEEVKDEIYQILYEEEINKRYMSWLEELREDSFIKIIF